MKKNLALTKPCLCAAFAAVGALIHSANAQDDRNPSNEPVVQVRHSTSDAKESKDSKATIEQQPAEKWWTITAEAGYQSKYIFRGTNLTPNSNGIAFTELRLDAHGFSLGAWYAHQIGTADVPGAFAIGEAGAGGIGGLDPRSFPGLFPPGVFPIGGTDHAIQTDFQELDLYLRYSHSFGPIDVTVGNIAFFIYRTQVDRFVTDPAVLQFVRQLGFNAVSPFTFDTIGDEQFDRLFVSLSTSKIPYVVPSVTYYQTIYNEGEFGAFPASLGGKRADKLGGYLEGKISAVIPLVHDVLTLEPTGIISYSFDDRSKGTSIPALDFTNGHLFNPVLTTAPSSAPLTGFNHAQIGAELVWRVTKHVSLTGFGAYSHHISAPTQGTNRNEGWGGGKVTLSF
jgi:hypothetical protein